MKSRISSKNGGALCDTERRCFKSLTIEDIIFMLFPDSMTRMRSVLRFAVWPPDKNLLCLLEE